MSKPKRRILFVDDDEQNWSPTLEPILRKAGWDWYASNSVHSALQLVAKDDFDLVLLDLGFPAEGMRGPQAVIEIRKHAPDVPIIAFTGSEPTDLQTAIECVRAGAWDYVLKTKFDGDRLLREAEKAAQLTDANRHKRRLLASIHRTLDTTPCFVSFTNEVETEPFVTAFAFRLLGPASSRQRTDADLLAKQIEWAKRIVAVLSSPDAPRAVELRYTVTPQDKAPSAVAAWLIGRGFGETPQRAGDAAEELFADLIPFLQLSEDVCRFGAVADEGQLRSLLRPFTAEWAVEFVRAMRAVKRNEPVGFHVGQLPERDDLHIARPVPFKPVLSSLTDLYAVAAKQPCPTVLCIDVQPFQWRQIANSISSEAEGLENKAFASLKQDLHNPREVHVILASEKRASDVLVNVVAKELTGDRVKLWQPHVYSKEECQRYQRSWGWAPPGRSKDKLLEVLYRPDAAASILRLPATDIASRNGPTPATTVSVKGGVLLGVSGSRGQEREVHLQRKDRSRHLYTIGQTGTGKTTFLLNLILQDIANGEGVGVIDPHGDLIESILPHIPEDRVDDVILFDPSDTDRPLGLNLLDVRDSAQRDLVVQETVDIITKLAKRQFADSVGPYFDHYLRQTLLALMEAPEASLLDAPRMMTDEGFRDWVLEHVTNPIALHFWRQEFAQSRRGSEFSNNLSYINSKFSRFLANEVVRNIIAQPRSSFDFRDVMDKGRILLANLSKGKLGEINSDLLGFILVNKFQIAAFGRADTPMEDRRQFHLYLDEFQNFTTDSIATLIAEARKFGLNLHLAHQFVGQLSQHIRDAVVGNVGTIVAFRTGLDDAALLAGQFSPVFTKEELVDLQNFSAYVKLLTDNQPQRPFLMQIAPPPQAAQQTFQELVRQQSRIQYGRPKAKVEEQIRKRLEIGTDEG